MNYKTKKEIKRRRYQLKRMRRTMKRQSKSYKLRRRHRLENRRRGLVEQLKWERKAYVELEVPKNFSFIDNTNELLEYFIKCKSLLHNKEKVQCDLSHITALSSDAIALLAACANDESFLGKRGRIRGNAPTDPELLKLFTESGFYNHVKATKVLKSAHKSDTNLFHQESNYQVQSDIAKNACILGTKHVFGSNKPFPDLYTYNAPNGHTMYTFIDLGVGIFDSIPVQVFKKIKRVIGLENNTDLVPDLLDGKIKSREKVDNKIRGKGIPQIAVNSNSQYFARAYIISNDVKINLKDKTAEALEHNFSGTMLFWELTNGDTTNKDI